METGLNGKTALITGGSSGIGLGIAQVLVSEGVRLAVASRNPDEQALDGLRSTGAQVLSIQADVSKEDDVVRMVSEAIESYGALDFYINNAAWTWHRPITKIDTASWMNTLQTNLSGCMWATREVSRHMICRGEGSIVIVGSTVCAFPAYKESSYRVSKMGLKAIMQNLSIELAPHGIRVNMVTPGHFRTRMTGNIPETIEENLKRIIPKHRFGNPIEVGNAVAFLLSERLSGYTTGADLVVDGGLTLNPLCFLGADEIREMNQP
ncbi:MAG: SDR family NAD(P)-dependent oxidoreductase [Armatimonadota bacterium]